MKILDMVQLQSKAPAIFAEKPTSEVSSRYQFIPTINVVELLRDKGWHPVTASQAAVRNSNHEGYQRHLLKFRHEDEEKMLVGDSVVELVLLNSHNRSSTYQLHAGLFRFTCANGMIIANELFGKISIRHINFNESDVIDASYKVIENVPQIASSVSEMRSVDLSDGERVAFAESAIALKYGDKPSPIRAEQILTTRRDDDEKPDLWTTFNVAQENLLKGGIRGWTSNHRRTRTRAVKGIQEDLRLNKGLWILAERMKEIKLGAAESIAA